MLVTIDSNEVRLIKDFCSMTNCDREINCDRAFAECLFVCLQKRCDVHREIATRIAPGS